MTQHLLRQKGVLLMLVPACPLQHWQLQQWRCESGRLLVQQLQGQAKASKQRNHGEGNSQFCYKI
jgi:hypothetical protein